MKTKKKLSIIILATLPDNGIKSLGSKCLLPFKGRYLIEHQLDIIRSALKNTYYDITIMSGFDSQRLCKSIQYYCDKFDIKLIKQNNDSQLNFAGSFLKGLNYAKYEDIVSINYGALFNKNIITNLVNNTHHNMVSITKNHSINENIKIGCSLNTTNIINIFYNLGNYKYLDINYWTPKTIRYIKKHIVFDDHKNKFMFELINLLHEHNFDFKYYENDPKDCIFIDSLKMLNKSKRMFINDNNTNKKTKY
jgi:hypothetical protein